MSNWPREKYRCPYQNFRALKMRQQLVAYVLEKQGSGLHAMVTEAIREHQATLT